MFIFPWILRCTFHVSDSWNLLHITFFVFCTIYHRKTFIPFCILPNIIGLRVKCRCLLSLPWVYLFAFAISKRLLKLRLFLTVFRKVFCTFSFSMIFVMYFKASLIPTSLIFRQHGMDMAKCNKICSQTDTYAVIFIIFKKNRN